MHNPIPLLIVPLLLISACSETTSEQNITSPNVETSETQKTQEQIKAEQEAETRKVIGEIKTELDQFAPAAYLQDFKVGNFSLVSSKLERLKVLSKTDYDALQTELSRQQKIYLELKSQSGEWNYSESIDKLTGKSTALVRLNSNNQVNFDFPYAGGSTLEIVLRKSPRFGTDVMLTISKGQFKCSFDGCHMEVAFDGKSPVKFELSEPSDGDHETMFLSNATRFISALKKSKKAVISVEFYQEGWPTFEYTTGGLKWN